MGASCRYWGHMLGFCSIFGLAFFVRKATAACSILIGSRKECNGTCDRHHYSPLNDVFKPYLSYLWRVRYEEVIAIKCGD